MKSIFDWFSEVKDERLAAILYSNTDKGWMKKRATCLSIAIICLESWDKAIEGRKFFRSIYMHAANHGSLDNFPKELIDNAVNIKS